MLLLAAVISISLLLFNKAFESSYWYIHEAINSGKSSLSFSWHIQCVSHLSDIRCYVSSSTFLSSGQFVWVVPLFILRTVPSIFKRGLPTGFIRLMRFLLLNLVRLGSFFSYFFFHVRFQYLQVYVFSFPVSFLILSFFVCSIPSVIFPLFIMAHFSMPNSISIYWLYSLIVGIRVSSTFSYFAHCLMSSIYIR